MKGRITAVIHNAKLIFPSRCRAVRRRRAEQGAARTTGFICANHCFDETLCCMTEGLFFSGIDCFHASFGERADREARPLPVPPLPLFTERDMKKGRKPNRQESSRLRRLAASVEEAAMDAEDTLTGGTSLADFEEAARRYAAAAIREHREQDRLYRAKKQYRLPGDKSGDNNPQSHSYEWSLQMNYLKPKTRKK